jgi:hypothetical protein
VHEFDCAIIGIENANNHANEQANLCLMDHLRAKTIARGLDSFSRGHSQPIILREGLLSQTSRPYLPEGRETTLGGFHLRTFAGELLRESRFLPVIALRK